jgi:predicted ATPase
MAEANPIRTPDQRLRVFVSSALQELAAERAAVREAINRMRLVPVMFDMGARSHPAREVYRAYLAQSDVFVGIYWQSYGWVAPGEEVSGLEDEYRLSEGMPRLVYVKSPAPERDARLKQMLDRVRDEADVSYHHFRDAAELQRTVEDDLAVLLSERFNMTEAGKPEAAEPALAAGLPVPVSALVGRESEIAAVSDLVLGEGVRLVTFTGPGGVGKSRLALEAGRRLQPAFDDGARYVELAPVRDAELVTSAIAAGLGLRTAVGPLIDDVKAYLRPRRLLVVLDNFEQVTDAAPLVAELLAAASGLTVLVTSRTVLRLRGEHEFPVPTLTVPATSADGDAGDLQTYPSVLLFVERAHAAVPGFELTSENADAVAEICRRLDGLPLAIELAAARVKLLSPQALLARLDHRLSLLTGGARDLPERQRTLRRTLDWSFDLLSAAGQALLERLGVFVGGFGFAAAEAVAGRDGDAAQADPVQAAGLIDTLSSLVESSLVQQADHDGEPRFTMLEMIREYALDRLGKGTEWREAHDRHAAYFHDLAVSAEPELRGPGQLAWLDRLEAEHANLAAAIAWFVAQDRPGSAHELGAFTWRFWWLRGHAEELIRYGQRMLAKREFLTPEQIAYVNAGRGFMLIATGDRAQAEALFGESLTLFRQNADKFGIATAESALGHLAALRGDYQNACELLEDGLALQRELGNDESVALAYNFLGQIPLSQGDPERAQQDFAKGLEAASHIPDRFPLLVSLYDLALSCQARGELGDAAEHLRQGLRFASEAGDEASVGYYLRRMAVVAGLQADPDRAVRLHSAADALLQATGSGWLMAYVPSSLPGDESLAALRSRLGDAAFQRSSATGASMGRARAVEYALGAHR